MHAACEPLDLECTIAYLRQFSIQHLARTIQP